MLRVAVVGAGTLLDPRAYPAVGTALPMQLSCVLGTLGSQLARVVAAVPKVGIHMRICAAVQVIPIHRSTPLHHESVTRAAAAGTSTKGMIIIRAPAR